MMVQNGAPLQSKFLRNENMTHVTGSFIGPKYKLIDYLNFFFAIVRMRVNLGHVGVARNIGIF